ncbi:MAG: ribonuclease H-like domain-containing protein [Gloeomargarita sp. SKYBB_i_bin120]|nr:ribonuclease H-like domain-containing protein [Gloeomargarita sp. SKYB120]MDW8177850.1 ribonuclease H-like domain-containing protein [Gloeomargarita sp. SKYBB_i_bin120]
MFTRQQIEKFLFLDIETAPAKAEFAELDEEMQLFWEKKARQYYKVGPQAEFDVASAYVEKAAFFSEFNRVVCVAFGYIRWVDDQPLAHLQSFCEFDEKDVLLKTQQLLSQPRTQDYTLCGHNIKEFDCPVLARRMLIHGILPLPRQLNNYGKKPWEIPHVDTMELWRFGEMKNHTSLALLARLFNIPSPKADMDGSQMFQLYWRERNLPKIKEYCEGDVRATMNLVLRLSGMPLLRAGVHPRLL